MEKMTREENCIYFQNLEHIKQWDSPGQTKITNSKRYSFGKRYFIVYGGI